MPVLVRLQRLFETGPLARQLRFPARQESSLLQYSPYARRTDRYHVCIQHHERQPPIALQRMVQVEAVDGFLFPRL